MRAQGKKAVLDLDSVLLLAFLKRRPKSFPELMPSASDFLKFLKGLLTHCRYSLTVYHHLTPLLFTFPSNLAISFSSPFEKDNHLS